MKTGIGKYTFMVVGLMGGVVCLMNGVFHLMVANADTVGAQDVIGKTNIQAQGTIFAGTAGLGNMAPGDKGTGMLTITNSSGVDEWVSIENVLTGGGNGHPSIFASYPKDGNPLTISYSIQTSGLLGTAAPITEGPFSSSETSPSFLLHNGQSATVTYTYNFPIQANNNYQGATGKMDVTVVSQQAAGGPHQNPNPPSSNPPGNTPGGNGGTPPSGHGGGNGGNPPPGQNPGGNGGSGGSNGSGGSHGSGSNGSGGHGTGNGGTGGTGGSKGSSGSPSGGNSGSTNPHGTGGSNASSPVVYGGTSPVTGFPVGTILLEGIAMLVGGGSLVALSRKQGR